MNKISYTGRKINVQVSQREKTAFDKFNEYKSASSKFNEQEQTASNGLHEQNQFHEEKNQ